MIRTTAEHPFDVLGEGWVVAGELRIGDLLTASDGEWYPVEDVLQTWVEETVYNVTVGECHTYFVRLPQGGVGIWSHNTQLPCNGDAPVAGVTVKEGKWDYFFGRVTWG